MDFLKGIIELVEVHPVGLLVALLVVAIWWLVRRLDRITKERESMARTLYHAQSEGLEVDDDTTVILKKYDKRTTTRPAKTERRR